MEALSPSQCPAYLPLLGDVLRDTTQDRLPVAACNPLQTQHVHIFLTSTHFFKYIFKC